MKKNFAGAFACLSESGSGIFSWEGSVKQGQKVPIAAVPGLNRSES
jgi:hypothetical protein